VRESQTNVKFLTKQAELKKIELVERDLESKRMMHDIVLPKDQQEKLSKIRENTSNLMNKTGYLHSEINERVNRLEATTEYFKLQKLLKDIEEKEMEFEKIGGNQTIRVDVRVIAATNRNLRDLIRKGEFREDLYYRLNVVEITVPPLRVRKEDLPVLVDNLIVKLNRKLGKKVKGLTKDAEEVFYSYDWPGNVRELENVVERVMVTVDEETLTKKNFIQYVSQLKAVPERDIELLPIDQMEQVLINKALVKYGNTVEGKRRAARALNISLATLYNKLKKAKYESSSI